jgi:ATP synthase subunit 6
MLFISYSPLSQFSVYAMVAFDFLKSCIIVTNMTSTIAIVFFNAIAVIWFQITELKLYLKKVQYYFESIGTFMYDLVFIQVKIKGVKYYPMLFVLFLSILLLNIISLFPYSFAVTSHFVWSMSMSLSTCLGIFFLGLIKHKLDYFKLFLQDIPLLLYPLMTAIELASYIIRAFSLAIRLSANIMAGHILVDIIGEVVTYLNYYMIDVAIVVIILLISLFFLEIGVACLQAYVFCLLLSLYLNDAVNLPVHI